MSKRNRYKDRSRDLARDYLDGDYFEIRQDAKNKESIQCRRVGIVTQKAEQVVEALGNDYPRMTNHQLRRFFTHARRLERQLYYGASFEQLKSEIERLITYAVDAQAKRKIPKSFETFIRANVELAVLDEKHFTEGFMPHFEAVVAFFAYRFPKY